MAVTIKTRAEQLFARADAQQEAGHLRSAFRLMLASAKLGDSGAQHNLGYFYDVGIGVKKNPRAALFWYVRAHRRGSNISANNIGTVYRDENNFKQALAWFQRAIALGDTDANLEIAKLYLKQSREPIKAIPYLKRIIDAGIGEVFEDAREQAVLLLAKISESDQSSRSSRS